jgi:hypothetical protein
MIFNKFEPYFFVLLHCIEKGFFLLLWIVSDAAVDAFPDIFSKNELSSSKNLVGISSQIITNALIQVGPFLIFFSFPKFSN